MPENIPKYTSDNTKGYTQEEIDDLNLEYKGLLERGLDEDQADKEMDRRHWIEPDVFPFIFQPDEMLIQEASLVSYTGMVIENLGFFGGGLSDSGLGGGLFSGKSKKSQGGFFDAKRAHIYLTNRRFVAAVAKQNIWGTEELGVESLLCNVPINTILGVTEKDNIAFSGFELSIKKPDGDVENITIHFFKKGDEERDKWLELIENRIGQTEDDVKRTAAFDDPIAIVKMRYAKGEISKEEFLEMLQLLRT